MREGYFSVILRAYRAYFDDLLDNIVNSSYLGRDYFYVFFIAYCSFLFCRFLLKHL